MGDSNFTMRMTHKVGGRVATLGMFIIDQFEVKGADGVAVKAEEEVMGGGGLYAMTGARIFLPPNHCTLIVDQGADFPAEFEARLKQLGEEMIWFRQREGKTSRAVNVYSGGKVGEGHQSFHYISRQPQLFLCDLLLPPSPFAPSITQPSESTRGATGPEWIHVVTGLARAQLIAEEAERIRHVGLGEEGFAKGWDGKLVWEPLGFSCIPSELPGIIDLAPHFAVISPNLLEMQSLLSITPSANPSPAEVVEAAEKFHRHLVQAHRDSTRRLPAIIVRAGEMGSYTLSTSWTGWVPAYWQKEEQDMVVDPTGGGNGFMGGLCAGLLVSGGDMRVGSIYGSAAASFTIQQRGLPVLSIEDGQEKWNDDDPWRRIRDLARRVDARTEP